MLEHRIARGDAQRFQFLIEASVPLARRHLHALTCRHGRVSIELLPKHNPLLGESLLAKCPAYASLLAPDSARS
ncbi:hypothetical protein [Mesorhizobium sp. M4A.F.Ca.ET.090.04.2.1]|uniref:hypothetical protein n=1 Tax=Mesorhizobium sp. M4A.F.Ca.ET.090.04.2.1 TaxID=2496663 RepID=UPI00167302DE|nr:hypothetical protein [Mesorhizobium sp. M4A.F.Ca.ET.090.04.2.1]